MKFLKPKIIISKCLEFDACRYDGQIINNKYILKLKDFIDFKPICPEVEIGMGIPRKPIRIISDNDKIKLNQYDTEIDFSNKMNAFSDNYISTIDQVDGFILKASSPSCGIDSTKIFKKGSSVPIGKGAGLFTSKIIKKFPNHPKEEEIILNNSILREQFFSSIFTLADFRSVINFDTLYKYHAKHKYLFMAYNQILMTKMGQIAANRENKKIKSVILQYYNTLLLLLSKKSRISSNINTQMHIMGYFKELLTSKEKEHFLEILELYRNKEIPISSVNKILESWIFRFENEYLINQSFFNPFPSELIKIR